MTNIIDDNWTSIFTTQYDHVAEIVKAVLEDNEIKCVIINKKDSAYHFGEIEIHVNSDNVLRAKQLLKGNSFE